MSGIVSGPLLRHTWRANRARVAVIALALAVWGFLMPVIYATFGRQLEALVSSGIIPTAFLRFLGADPFSLNGAVALGAVHPIAIALQVVYPVGFAAAAIAGERRRSLFLTLLVAIVSFAVITTVAQLAGTVIAAAVYGVADQLDAGAILFLGLNTIVFLGAMTAISLAASACFDRLTPAIGIALGVVLVGYVLDILGTLWPDAEGVQPLSPFHYLRPLEILARRGAIGDIVVLAALGAIAVAFGLWRFPRRDIAAPA